MFVHSPPADRPYWESRVQNSHHHHSGVRFITASSSITAGNHNSLHSDRHVVLMASRPPPSGSSTVPPSIHSTGSETSRSTHDTTPHRYRWLLGDSAGAQQADDTAATAFSHPHRDVPESRMRHHHNKKKKKNSLTTTTPAAQPNGKKEHRSRYNRPNRKNSIAPAAGHESQTTPTAAGVIRNGSCCATITAATAAKEGRPSGEDHTKHHAASPQKKPPPRQRVQRNTASLSTSSAAPNTIHPTSPTASRRSSYQSAAGLTPPTATGATSTVRVRVNGGAVVCSSEVLFPSHPSLAPAGGVRVYHVTRSQAATPTHTSHSRSGSAHAVGEARHAFVVTPTSAQLTVGEEPETADNNTKRLGSTNLTTAVTLTEVPLRHAPRRSPTTGTGPSPPQSSAPAPLSCHSNSASQREAVPHLQQREESVSRVTPVEEPPVGRQLSEVSVPHPLASGTSTVAAPRVTTDARTESQTSATGETKAKETSSITTASHAPLQFASGARPLPGFDRRPMFRRLHPAKKAIDLHSLRSPAASSSCVPSTHPLELKPPSPSTANTPESRAGKTSPEDFSFFFSGRASALSAVPETDGGVEPPPSRILDFLFLGGVEDAIDAAFLERENITDIVNISREEYWCPSRHTVVHSFPLDDHGTADVRAYFASTRALLDRVRLQYFKMQREQLGIRSRSAALASRNTAKEASRSDGTVRTADERKKETASVEKPPRVLVHCQKGRSRSATVVAAYLMYRNAWTVDQALRFLRERRPCVEPNIGFLNALRVFQDEMLSEHHRQQRVNQRSVVLRHVAWAKRGLTERAISVFLETVVGPVEKVVLHQRPARGPSDFLHPSSPGCCGGPPLRPPPDANDDEAECSDSTQSSTSTDRSHHSHPRPTTPHELPSPRQGSRSSSSEHEGDGTSLIRHPHDDDNEHSEPPTSVRPPAPLAMCMVYFACAEHVLIAEAYAATHRDALRQTLGDGTKDVKIKSSAKLCAGVARHERSNANLKREMRSHESAK